MPASPVDGTETAGVGAEAVDEALGVTGGLVGEAPRGGMVSGVEDAFPHAAASTANTSRQGISFMMFLNRQG